MRNVRYLASLLLASLTTAAAAAAQVGHAPGSSPYSDIRRGHTLTVLGGQIGGEGGRFAIGPHDGSVFGARYDIRTSRPLQLGLGIMRGELDRLIVDPFVQVNQRVSGPVRQSLTFAELNLQLNLTGGKSWHRLAPFVGAGAGVAFAGGTPADTSGFAFDRKFYFAPHAGMRIFITHRVHLRAEARTAFWKLSYPTTFQQEPPAQQGTEDNPNAVITNGSTSEWTTNTWLQIGLGFGFSP
jgi:hypothetical protein